MKTRFTLLALIFISVCLFPQYLSAQDEELFPGGVYDKNIPTPYEVFGHRFGELHTYHWQMENFIHTLAKISDRMKVMSYGKTYQGRKLYLVIISSPENM